MTFTGQQAQDALQQAEIIHTATEVQAAVTRIAHEINLALADMHPVVLSVMARAGLRWELFWQLNTFIKRKEFLV